MSSLFSIGTSGLNAAQLGLKTVANNISNAGTDGYSRQSTIQVERPGQYAGRYTVGSGVDVVAVQRAYSQYLTTALWNANSGLQNATTANALASTLNGVFSGSGDLQGALDDFYAGFSTVANAPGDAGARQSLLGEAAAVTQVFNTLSGQFDQQRSQLNGQISDTVADINGTVDKIAALNLKIAQAGASAPNDLLDQRDGLVKQLAGYTGISTASQPDGTLSIYSSSGQVLVNGGYAYGFKTGTDVYDAGRTVVLDAAGNDISSRLSGGSLGALLDYRSQVLDPAQNALGRAALALAGSVNAQQAKGLDLNGQQGAPIFSVPAPAVSASTRNTGGATVGASISYLSQLTGADYVLTRTDTGWTLATSDGQNVSLSSNPDGSLSAAGLTFNVSGTAASGDSFLIRPTRAAAGKLAVAMSDPSQIAAAAALTVTPASSNTGSAVGSIEVADAGNANLFAGATLTFNSATNYTITDASGNPVGGGTYTSGSPITFDGWSLNLTGTPAAGDSFTVGKNSAGLNDNHNALALAALADGGVLDGGKTSVVDAYAALTNQVGNAGSQAASSLTTQTSLYNQALAAQQSGAGVNLDEEAASLIKYQQAYQASAQVIATAQSLFTSLISAVQTR
ncbi:flagellar hook-associated protein FlgK [Aerosticca soli]|uniref:Flagellar hook-associated protein 1 n=1 Tax=Aerosticca soli TaxID=2010829 RepID=A0A2Z6E886_9GAMM|nr:flagellar hook-associated protein FlgK [Aerosticca soli]BBD81022.1 flagellar hook-associated protein FlgK [Aerosticca soli]